MEIKYNKKQTIKKELILDENVLEIWWTTMLIKLTLLYYTLYSCYNGKCYGFSLLQLNLKSSFCMGVYVFNQSTNIWVPILYEKSCCSGGYQEV